MTENLSVLDKAERLRAEADGWSWVEANGAAPDTPAPDRYARLASELAGRNDPEAPALARAIGLGDREAGTPSETILGLTRSIGAEIIVMGAYGRRGIREIFGSTTREVLNACPTVLFLHH